MFLAARRATYLWLVGCEGHSTAYVKAENWERATVGAAAYWAVPWREVAAKCYVIRKSEVRHNICGRCGGIFYGPEALCAVCTCAARDEELNARRGRGRIKRFTK